MKCRYCKGDIKNVTGKKIYPHREDLWDNSYYQCDDCGAYVSSSNPGNTVADSELRKLRVQVHQTIDPLWKKEQLTRTKVYQTMAYILDLDMHHTHVGMFNKQQCRKLLQIGKYGILSYGKFIKQWQRYGLFR